MSERVRLIKYPKNHIICIEEISKTLKTLRVFIVDLYYRLTWTIIQQYMMSLLGSEQKKVSKIPMFPIRLRITFVVFLSCLVLVLGLFSSTSVASAHNTQAVQSQVSASTLAEDRGRVKCRTTRTVNSRFTGFQDQNTGVFIPNGHVVVFRGQRGVYSTGRQGRRFDRVVSRRWARVTLVTICGSRRTRSIINQPI